MEKEIYEQSRDSLVVQAGMAFDDLDETRARKAAKDLVQLMWDNKGEIQLDAYDTDIEDVSIDLDEDDVTALGRVHDGLEMHFPLSDNRPENMLDLSRHFWYDDRAEMLRGQVREALSSQFDDALADWSARKGEPALAVHNAPDGFKKEESPAYQKLMDMAGAIDDGEGEGEDVDFGIGM